LTNQEGRGSPGIFRFVDFQKNKKRREEEGKRRVSLYPLNSGKGRRDKKSEECTSRGRRPFSSIKEKEKEKKGWKKGKRINHVKAERAGGRNCVLTFSSGGGKERRGQELCPT